MGARSRLLCPLCSHPLLLGCQGKACLSTCCLSHGEAPGEGMSWSVATYAWTKLLHSKFLAFISAIYAWPLPEATSTTAIVICTVCGQPAVP